MPENSKKTLMFGVRLHFSVKSSWSRNFVYVKSVSPFNLTEFSNVNKAAKLSFFTANQGRSFFRDSLFRHLKTEIELGNGRKINLPELGLKLGRRICSLSNKLKIRCFDWFARLCNFLWKLWPKNLSLVNSLLCSTLSSKLLSYHVTIKSFVQSTDFSHLSPNSSNVSANL